MNNIHFFCPNINKLKKIKIITLPQNRTFFRVLEKQLCSLIGLIIGKMSTHNYLIALKMNKNKLILMDKFVSNNNAHTMQKYDSKRPHMVRVLSVKYNYWYTYF